MGKQHHIQLNGTGFTLADEGPGGLAWREAAQNALSIKTAQGDPKYSDQSHLSVWNQTDWRGGRGENRAEAGNRFSDGNMATWLKEILTLRPLAGVFGVTGVGTPEDGQRVLAIGGERTVVPAYLTAATPTRRLAVAFTITGGATVTGVTLPFALEDNQVGPGTGTLTVRIETNSGGAPSGTLVHANATGTLAISNLTPLWQWFRVAFGGSVALSTATLYWIVVSASGHSADAQPRWGEYDIAGSSVRARYDGSAWTTGLAGFHYFNFEEVTRLASTPTVSANFNGKFYIAAGTQIYRWDDLNLDWDAVGSALGNAVTDMDVVDNVLWICTGKGNNAYTMSAAESFTEKTGITGQVLHAFNGYLYRANGNRLYYTSDGTTWVDADDEGKAFLAGSDQYDINGMAGLEGTLLIGKPDGLFEFAPGDFLIGIERWDTQLDSNNGKGMVEWNGAVYIPVKHGLVKYDKKSFDSKVGPDQDEGLPADRIGKIVSMAPLLNYLLVAVDATENSRYGSVLLYNGYGWHELGRAWRAGERVRMVGYDFTLGYVWYSSGRQMVRVRFSDLSDNIITYAHHSSFPSEATGYVETSWISGGLLDVWKLLSSFWANKESVSDTSGIFLYIDYRVDRQTRWRHLGKIIFGGGEEIDFQAADSIGSPGAVSGIDATTGAVTLSAIGGIAVGDFVRIGSETRYVTAVNGDAFTPQAPYDNAAVGDQPAGGYPTMREVQLRLRLHNYRPATLSNVYLELLRAVRLNWANQLTKWNRYQFTIRCESGIKLLDETLDSRTGTAIYNQLMAMLEGSTLFVLNDLDGVDRTVQMVNASVVVREYKHDLPGNATEISRLVTLDMVEI